jgi:hypothetical protein
MYIVILCSVWMMQCPYTPSSLEAQLVQAVWLMSGGDRNEWTVGDYGDGCQESLMPKPP